MASLKQGITYLRHNRSQFCDSFIRNFLTFLPDRLYLSLRFRFQMGYWINWRHPKTFSEKLQWLKLYRREPQYTVMVDKLNVKQYVSDKIGKEYIIPTLGIWASPEEINWDVLPVKFVLKTTHGGGSTGVVVCQDKFSINKSEAIKKLNDSLKKCIYKDLREWPYKNVTPCIIAEQYIEAISSDGMIDLPDYKFFCFNGKPIYCQVIAGRNTKMTVDFYDLEWNHQPFHEPSNTDFSNIIQAKPSCYSKMIELAAILAKGTSFLRVDFYEVNGKVYFGELTFFPTSGFGGFEPKEWDNYWGNLINLEK